MTEMKPAAEPQIQIEDRPYVIHERGNGANDWMRFSIRGHGQQRYSPGKDNLDEAREIVEKNIKKTTTFCQTAGQGCLQQSDGTTASSARQF